jgi:hypothetical protein
MESPDKPEDNARRRLTHARRLHADADAARERSAGHKQMANNAKETAAQLRSESAKVAADAFSRVRTETDLQMAERHVTEADRHVQNQRTLIEVLVRDKHEKVLEHARKVLAVLEQSQKLAEAHLALERDFHAGRS